MPDGIQTAAGVTLPVYDNPQAWCGPDLKRSADWVYRFQPAEIGELEAAAAAAMASGRDLTETTRADFPLPGLAPTLKRIRQEVLHGRGIVLLRGLPVDRLSREMTVWMYWALGRHWGEPCSQNGLGHVLGHVKDLGYDPAEANVRGYHTNARLLYHADRADVVGLLCFKPAKSGGLSSAVSSTAIWNEMVRQRPDLAEALLQPVCRTRYGEVPPGMPAWQEFCIYNPMPDHIICSYLGGAIRKGQQLPGAPQMTDAQREAIEMFDRLAESPDLHIDMAFEPGDIQLLNNHFILHSRTAFEDFPEPGRRRHLLRLWLACDDGPALPPAYVASLQGRTASGRPNGVAVPGVPLHAPMDAE